MFARSLLLALLTIPLYRQTYTGSIRGRVTDPTGLAVPNAQVVLTEVSTNMTVRIATNDVGDYLAGFLKPGEHRLQVSAQGF
jgi:hypothetical protein